jgi:hypothetical protein
MENESPRPGGKAEASNVNRRATKRVHPIAKKPDAIKQKPSKHSRMTGGLAIY